MGSNTHRRQQQASYLKTSTITSMILMTMSFGTLEHGFTLRAMDLLRQEGWVARHPDPSRLKAHKVTALNNTQLDSHPLLTHPVDNLYITLCL